MKFEILVDLSSVIITLNFVWYMLNSREGDLKKIRFFNPILLSLNKNSEINPFFTMEMLTHNGRPSMDVNP